jgi:hypothetical protein
VFLAKNTKYQFWSSLVYWFEGVEQFVVCHLPQEACIGLRVLNNLLCATYLRKLVFVWGCCTICCVPPTSGSWLVFFLSLLLVLFCTDYCLGFCYINNFYINILVLIFDIKTFDYLHYLIQRLLFIVWLSKPSIWKNLDER